MIGLIFVLFIFLYLLFGFFLYGYIRGWGPGKGKSLLITLVLMLGIPFGDVIPGKLYMRYLCAAKSGFVFKKTIDVPGYSVGDRYFLGCSSTCVEELKEWHRLSTPKFIESRVIGQKTEAFVEKPGLYRFELIKRNTQRCKTQDYIEQNFPNIFMRYALPEGYCIFSQRIESSTADYIVKEWKWDTNYSRLLGISRVRTLVQEKDSGDILGSNTGFIHRGGWLRRWLAGFMAVGQPDKCLDKGDFGFTWSVLRGVFKSQ
jgi:hypothetical protein